eukprot:TRINITY_DN1248_c0_g1_i1.p1 TRINITY_DN1248_c0_g1~~TRINITY_DN1248_c0_g1_i1.p1  ORF type:complete len:421 (-),score=96.64 TRINITY_DN1248_c0_g1_i1:42-1304(-)
MASLTEINSIRTDFSKGKLDPKVSKTQEIIGDSRAMTAPLLNLQKNVIKYHALLVSLANVSSCLTADYAQLEHLYSGDLGDVMKDIKTLYQKNEERLQKVAERYMADVIVPLGTSVKEDDKEVAAFEKSYKKAREASLSTITKSETRAKKLAKKRKLDNTQLLDSELNTLSGYVAEHDKLLTKKLNEAECLHRSRYCKFLKGYYNVLSAEVDVWQANAEDHADIRDRKVKVLMDSSNNAQDKHDRLIHESKENLGKAMDAIEDVKTTGNFDSYSTLDYDPDYNNSGSDKPYYGGRSRATVSPGSMQPRQRTDIRKFSDDMGLQVGSPNMNRYENYNNTNNNNNNNNNNNLSGSGGESEGGEKVKAKFAYTKQRPDELSFNAGDVFDLVEQTTDNWWKGEREGQVGLFPSSYVNKLDTPHQ